MIVMGKRGSRNDAGLKKREGEQSGDEGAPERNVRLGLTAWRVFATAKHHDPLTVDKCAFPV